MMQRWKKLGLIYDGSSISGFSYATVPVGQLIGEDRMRIFFSSRDNHNRSHPFVLDYDLGSRRIVDIRMSPLLDLGELGAFDDSGVMPTCLVEHGEDLRLYYIGWNLGRTVPFRNSIGIAVSYDAGLTFERMFRGPVVDRTMIEPHFNASCCVRIDEGLWRMWYLNCVRWEKVDNEIRHFYHIKYAESSDGVIWRRDGTVAIDFLDENEYAISVPRVLKEKNIYKMWYSYRAGARAKTYRIGYAESPDGIDWTRRDDQVDLDVTEGAWDGEMICYPFIFDSNGRRYMLYNGNGYGRTGFGLAVLGV